MDETDRLPDFDEYREQAPFFVGASRFREFLNQRLPFLKQPLSFGFKMIYCLFLHIQDSFQDSYASLSSRSIAKIPDPTSRGCLAMCKRYQSLPRCWKQVQWLWL